MESFDDGAILISEEIFFMFINFKSLEDKGLTGILDPTFCAGNLGKLKLNPKLLLFCETENRA